MLALFSQQSRVVRMMKLPLGFSVDNLMKLAEPYGKVTNFIVIRAQQKVFHLWLYLLYGLTDGACKLLVFRGGSVGIDYFRY